MSFLFLMSLIVNGALNALYVIFIIIFLLYITSQQPHVLISLLRHHVFIWFCLKNKVVQHERDVEENNFSSSCKILLMWFVPEWILAYKSDIHSL